MRNNNDDFFGISQPPKLKLQLFKDLRKSVKTNIAPIDFLIVAFLIWLEEIYIEYKVEKEIDDAIKQYHKEIDEIEKDWKETATIKEEWNNGSIHLPTLSISNPVIEKDETP